MNAGAWLEHYVKGGIDATNNQSAGLLASLPSAS